MLAAVTSGLTTVIGWVGTVITSITGADGALAPLLPCSPSALPFPWCSLVSRQSGPLSGVPE